MSNRAILLNRHCVELCKLFTQYDNCLEFEERIGVKCDVSNIIDKIDAEIAIINNLLGV